jgi:hypothetical protein
MSFASAILAIYSKFFSLPLIWIRSNFSVGLMPQNDTYSPQVTRSAQVCKYLIAKISKASVDVNPYELVVLVMILVMICAECKCAYYLRVLSI